MKKTKQLLFAITALITLNLFSQDISIHNNIALVNGKEYVSINKKKSDEYSISSLKTNEKIIVVKTNKRFNTYKNEYVLLPTVTFVDLNKTWDFETESITNEKDVIRFIYNLKIVSLSGEVNKEMALEYYDYFEKQSKTQSQN
ncbi:hypothetical protein ES677_02020 [Bizionia gelidisalsuginis]|uniref:DUF4468 domain-containing protein n=1 Tax=Bizionia gelidisalsuginis TaxID=291188 RepID=A0ABY3MDD0_9FLAO|nr:hypothetical protein [Bizionia gelidisalsuginis]TYC16979.1 hypothetical protein ES677_02020 [Bizionia gelidisalsuginis]